MKKQELINLLRKADYWEDDFILKYDDPSFWTLLEASLSKGKYDKIRHLFRKNIDDSYIHKKMVENLIKKLNKNE